MSHSDRGFTLLEVLLAMALAATIMLGVFSVMRIQTRITRDGGSHVEQAQLARSILELIAQDIRRCLPVNGDPQIRLREAAAATPLLSKLTFTESLSNATDRVRGRIAEPEFDAASDRLLNLGIIGDEQYLILSPHHSSRNAAVGLPAPDRNEAGMERTRIDSPLARSPVGHPVNAEFGPDSRRTATAGFTRVTYFMVENLEIGPVADQGNPSDSAFMDDTLETIRDREHGLTRMVQVEHRDEEEHFTAGQAVGDGQLDVQTDGNVWATIRNASGNVRSRIDVVAREVKYLRFRYLGDGSWQSSWDGSAGLPQAIEIELEIAVGGVREKKNLMPPVETEWESSKDRQLPDDGMQDRFGRSNGSDTRLYRLVVRVPAGVMSGENRQKPSPTSREFIPETTSRAGPRREETR